MATKYVQEARALVTGESRDEPVIVRIKSLINSLGEKLELLKRLDEEILQISPTDAIEGEILEADETNTKIVTIIGDCRRLVTVTEARREETEIRVTPPTPVTADSGSVRVEVPATPSSGSARTIVKPKLPKLVIHKFNGEITKFRTFWDSFSSAIHTNTELSPIDKFNYLKSLLEGPASQAIQGLSLSATNYQAAVEILQDRFGKTQQIISSHMDNLLKISPCNDDKASHLRSIYDKIYANIRGLESLGVNKDQYGSFLIPIIMSKLPSEVRLQIARVSVREVWEVEELMDVIKGEVEAREISDNIKVTERKPPDTSNIRKYPAATASTLLVREGNGRIICVYCKGDHFSTACESIREVKIRKETLRREGRCFLCLSQGHKASQCSSKRKCRKCNKRHHQSICESDGSVQNRDIISETSNPPKNDAPVTSTTATTGVKSNSKILLQTARAYVSSEDGSKLLPVRVLMDGGSQRSYITNSLKTKLSLTPLRKESLNLNTFGEEQYKRKQCDLVKVNMQGQDGTDIEIYALSSPMICSPPSTAIDISGYPHLQELHLSEFSQDTPVDHIDILIGSDHYWDVVTGDISRERDGPVAIDSKFGWLLSGPLKRKENSVITNLAIHEVASTALCSNNNELQANLHRFWEVESIGILERSESEEDHQFFEHISFNKEQGRYVVTLPWKQIRPPCDQFDNLNSCVNRLYYLRMRMKNDECLLKEYECTFQQQLQSGIIERVPKSQEKDKGCYFLPHHGVIRQDKATTKLRIVFDGSSKAKGGSSLNECLDKGPNLTPHVFNILVRFRVHRVGLVADIEKAFHQIVIEESDRNLLRFLWFKNVKDEQPEIVQYRFCRLVFGLTSSPAILNAVIQKHLSRYKGSEPQVMQLLAESFYVDDFVGGAENIEGGYEIFQTSRKVMKEGGFNLRKWHTNNKVLQEKMCSNCTNEQCKPAIANTASIDKDDMTEPKETKVLGLNWRCTTDEIYFDFTDLIAYFKTLPATKRSVLQFSAKIFDPLGVLSPFTTQQKILFQHLCVQGVNWDDPLEDELLKKWNQLPKELLALSQIRIPRCYISVQKGVLLYQLHGFSDASEKAYAAVIYLRKVYTDGSIDSMLVSSKTRVAPIKRQTIPRLELLGAVILARLMNTTYLALQPLVSELRLFYWVDSYTTLCWIKNVRPWKQYVQQRTAEIRKLSNKESWRFCPGTTNPADIPSRSCNGVELPNKCLWWKGPDFLQNSPETWPDMPTSYETTEAQIELQKSPTAITHALCSTSDVGGTLNLGKIIDITRYGTMDKLLRVTGYVLKAVESLKAKTKQLVGEMVVVEEVLTAIDLLKAEEAWIKTIQWSSFPDEIESLRKGSKATIVMKQLNLFQDEKGIIRCQGRINNAVIADCCKQPILLPPHNRFTELFIREKHFKVLHNGIRDTLSAVRETHWILRGREAVKRVLRKCVICKRYEGKSVSSPPLPQLPEERVGEYPPFANTGVDFAGPLYIKSDGKVYVCLFTCGITRAIHLELTTDLSASSFLQAFRRFVGRRGLPTKIISDNAKGFKAASKDISKVIRSTAVRQYVTTRKVSWQFIVEKAPWWGGFWERLVRSVKNCLKKSVGRSLLDFEELRTLMVEIESAINNRPLTYVYDDENGITYPLTPSDLIYGRQLSTSPNSRHFDVISTNKTLSKKARHHFRILESFNRQWQKEYLLSLRENYNVKKQKEKSVSVLTPGDVVLVKDEGTARCWWKLAEIDELIYSKDDVIRAARIKVISSDKVITLRRPITHLIPLEVSPKQQAGAP